MGRREEVESEKILKTIAGDDLKELAAALPGPLYLVGGTVRDALCGLPAGGDADICAPLCAAEFSKRAIICGFSVTAEYPATGTVKIEKGKRAYEYASFRTEEYARGHKPCATRFATDIYEDARRRDFRCDAIYFDISSGELIDPLGGAEDIEKKTVSAVRDADEVFSADGLRIMRLARICAATGFSPDIECLEAAKAHADLIDDIAPERIWAELEKILAAESCAGLDILRDTGIVDRIMGGDRGEGNELSLCRACSGDARLAALFLDAKGADISSPLSVSEAERLSGEAERALSSLRAPKARVLKVARLIRMLSGSAGDDIFFFLDNADVMDDFLALLRAARNPSAKSFEKAFEEMKCSGRPMSLRELAVNGEDIEALGFSGAQIGRTLRFLLGEAAAGRAENSREALMSLAKISENNCH